MFDANDIKRLQDRLDKLHGQALGRMSLAELHPSQRRTTERIIASIQRIALSNYEDSARERRSEPSMGQHQRRTDIIREEQARPHNVFLIDGARGTGKTTALLNISRSLNYLTLAGWAESVQGGDTGGYADIKVATSVRGVRRQTAHLLPIVMPHNLAKHQTLMDAILAQIHHSLAKMDGPNAFVDKRLEDGPWRDVAQLQQKLQEVYSGWISSRQDGIQVAIQDSFDFSDFVEKQATYGVHSYRRIDLWHDFVDQFLNYAGCQLLIIIIDDIDLDTKFSHKIIEDVKQYLASPRIVTIAAADMSLLRHEMIRDQYDSRIDLSKFILDFSVKTSSSNALIQYLQDCNDTVTANIDKIFPVSYRNFIGLVTRSDFDQLSHNLNLTYICAWKFSDSSTDNLYGKIEWWHICGLHHGLLTDSLRGYVQIMHRLLVSAHQDQEDSAPKGERIYQALLAYAKAMPLRNAGKIPGGLRSAIGRLIQSSWRLLQSEIPPDMTYAYALCDYWLDVELASRLLDPTTSEVLTRWLPTNIPIPTADPSGEVAQLGVAGYFGNSILPWSCLYVGQLRHLDAYLPDAVTASNTYIYTPIISDDDPIDEDSFLEIQERRQRSMSLGSEYSTATDLYFGALRPRVSLRSDQIDKDPWWTAYYIFEYWDLYCKNFKLDTEIFPKTEIFTEWAEIAFTEQSYIQNIGELFVAILQGEGDSSSGSRSEEQNVIRNFQAFYKKFCRIAALRERERQQFISQWILALRVAQQGNNFTVTEPEPGSALHIKFHATDWRWPNHENLYRLTQLASTTEALVAQRSARTAILLAWSLTPIISALFWIGDGPVPAADVTDAWRRVRGALANARSRLDNLTGQTPDRNQVVAAGALSQSLQVPEDYLPAKTWRNWHFPDFNDDGLADVRTHIQRSIDFLDQNIEAYEREAAASTRASGDDVTSRIATILGIGTVPARKILEELDRAFPQHQ